MFNFYKYCFLILLAFGFSKAIAMNDDYSKEEELLNYKLYYNIINEGTKEERQEKKTALEIEQLFFTTAKDEKTNKEYYILKNGWKVVYDDTILPQNNYIEELQISKTQKSILLVLLNFNVRELLTALEKDRFEGILRRQLCLEDWHNESLSIYVKNFYMKEFDEIQYPVFNKRVSDVSCYVTDYTDKLGSMPPINFHYDYDLKLRKNERNFVNFKLYNDEFLKTIIKENPTEESEDKKSIASEVLQKPKEKNDLEHLNDYYYSFKLKTDEIEKSCNSLKERLVLPEILEDLYKSYEEMEQYNYFNKKELVPALNNSIYSSEPKKYELALELKYKLHSKRIELFALAKTLQEK